MMVSTDSHLGFMEKDPVRSNDSFAAFDEVLSIAKREKVCLGKPARVVQPFDVEMNTRAFLLL